MGWKDIKRRFVEAFVRKKGGKQEYMPEKMEEIKKEEPENKTNIADPVSVLEVAKIRKMIEGIDVERYKTKEDLYKEMAEKNGITIEEAEEIHEEAAEKVRNMWNVASIRAANACGIVMEGIDRLF